MSHYRRTAVAGGCYFFTVVTERRRPILTQAEVRTALRAAIVAVRESRPFDILAWVLLPDHLHAIWRLPPGDADFSTRWSQIKRRVTHDCGALHADPTLMSARRTAKRHGTLWQHRFWEHLIRDEHDYGQHMDYLHFNPVKHGLVQRVADWPYSSFHRLVREGVYAPDWGVGVDGLDIPGHT